MGIASNLGALARLITSGGLVPSSAMVAPLPRGYLSGLELSRATATTIGVAIGSARNEDAGVGREIALSSAITKTLGAFAVGSGNGSLDTGTIAANTWYHGHAIRRDSDGAGDFLLSLSPTAPIMPSGFTARRRLGAIRTDGSSQITPFLQTGDIFRWDVAVQDYNANNPGTAAVLRSVFVPTGIIVRPIHLVQLSNGTTAGLLALISDPAQTDTAPSGSAYHLICTNATAGRAGVLITDIPTNTSAQLRTRLSASGASDAILGVTHGWIDTRGR